VLTDRHDQFLDIAEDSAADSVLSDVAKEPLHHVEPRTAGWCEVYVESRVASQPPLYLGMLVCRVVVRNQVDLLATGCDIVDHAEKLQPFLVAMSVVAHANDGPIEGVHRCEQGCGPVSLVVVGHGSAAPLLDRQSRLCSVQRLDLALLVCTKDDGMLRRVEVEPDNGFQL